MATPGHTHTAPINRPVGGWLPIDRDAHRRWLAGVIAHVKSHPIPHKPVIRNFKKFIESDPVIRMLFSSMFNEIPHKYREYDPIHQRQVLSYDQMLDIFNYLLDRGPSWSETAFQVGLVGFPFNAVLDWPIATASGHAAFLRKDVDAEVKKLYDVWTAYLDSPKSREVLGTGPDHWFCEDAVEQMTIAAAHGLKPVPFDQVFVCSPNERYHGYTSWDNFFTRQFRDGVRPIASPDDKAVIVSACESAPYRLAHNVRARDEFWVKSQPYSLLDMLYDDDLAPQFVGGTVFQAFLSALSYHRWHSPVDGTIRKIVHIPGTYYSETLSEGFVNPDGPDPAAPNLSQGYITCVATRVLIFIESDNPHIGLMCIMPVGMAEVSTCEVTVREGDKVKKGHELGMFHFGGSTHCLFFRPGVQLEWVNNAKPPYPENEVNIPINSHIATVVSK